MRKVLVIGSGGSGKSTLATRLGVLLGVEVLHLDSFYWHAGWIETPKAEWLKTVEDLIRRDAWIMDGNYSGTLAVRVAACDTVIFLDLPRLLCVSRVLKRVAMYRDGGSRPDMAANCPERFSAAFLWWVWNYPARTRPKVLELLKAHAGSKQVFRLRSRADVEMLLTQVKVSRHPPTLDSVIKDSSRP